MSHWLLKGHSNSKMDQTWKCCQSAPSQKAKNNKVRCQVVDSTSHHRFCLYRIASLQTDFLRKSVSSKGQQDFEEKGKSFTSDVYNEFNASSFYFGPAQAPFLNIFILLDVLRTWCSLTLKVGHSNGCLVQIHTWFLNGWKVQWYMISFSHWITPVWPKQFGSVKIRFLSLF